MSDFHVFKSLSFEDNEPKPNIPTPRIDFTKVSNAPAKEVQIKTEFSKPPPQEILDLLSQHYNRVQAILGLDQVKERYELKIENTSLGALHRSPFNDNKGAIVISKKSLELACLEYNQNLIYNPDEKKILKNPYFYLFEMIATLAHELYHKRQYTFFRASYLSRTSDKKYMSDDPIKYINQVIELGPRLFANSYIEQLKSELNSDDYSLWAICLRKFNSIQSINLTNSKPKFIDSN